MSSFTADAPLVLVVDDDPQVEGLLWVLLRRLGCTPLVATCGYSAVRMFMRRPGAFALVLMDVEMRDGDGPSTLDALRDIAPGVRCCFVTSGTGGYTEGDLLARGALEVLYKPFTIDQL